MHKNHFIAWVALGGVLAVLAGLGLALALRGHNPSPDWSKNGTHHWHACTDEGCTHITDYVTHTWDGGKVTRLPEKEKGGEITYTCTVCGQTRTASTPRLGMTAEEWAQAISFNAFSNMTYTMNQTFTPTNDDEAPAFQRETVIRVVQNTIYRKKTTTYEGQAPTVVEDTLTGKDRTGVIESLINTLAYSNHYCDEQNGVYRRVTPSKGWSLDENGNTSIITITDTVLTFEGGRLVRLEMTHTQDYVSGTDYLVTTSQTFSDYGTTVAPIA